MDTLIEVKDLYKYFPIGGEQVKAVDNVSFTIRKGETVGLVGESGCGKTTIGRIILRLIPPTSGKVIFEDRDLFRLTKGELKQARRRMGIVFQDPYSSLNPRMNIQSIVGEPLQIHTKLRALKLQEKVAELLAQVGLEENALRRYPHEFSGGQRQRIAMARALALEPVLLVLDEPTSALDVSVQAQVLNLIVDLQNKLDLTYLFISHDLILVQYIANRIMVMYLGRVVESGPAQEVFNHPRHPYTRALISAIPIPDVHIQRKEILLEGNVPSPIDVPPGCSFNTRCPEKKGGICEREAPVLTKVGEEHYVACHLI